MRAFHSASARSGLVSCRWRPWGCALQSLAHPEDPYPSLGRVPSCRSSLRTAASQLETRSTQASAPCERRQKPEGCRRHAFPFGLAWGAETTVPAEPRCLFGGDAPKRVVDLAFLRMARWWFQDWDAGPSGESRLQGVAPFGMPCLPVGDWPTLGPLLSWAFASSRISPPASWVCLHRPALRERCAADTRRCFALPLLEGSRTPGLAGLFRDCRPS